MPLTSPGRCTWPNWPWIPPVRVLKPGGTALIKVFQGAGFTELLGAARQRFATVRMLKPEASRARSPELYLLAKDFTIV